MAELSFETGNDIAAIYKVNPDKEPIFVGKLKVQDQDDFITGTPAQDPDDVLLRELIGKSKLTKDDKIRLTEILSSKVSSNSKTKATFLSKYLKNNNTELILPQGYFIKQIHSKEPGSKRKTIYIPAKSNSGKTTWIAEYLEDYLEQYPNDDVMIFSGIPREEPSLAKFGDKIIRADLNQFRDDPITDTESLADLKDTFCIFDDVNSIPDLKTRKAILALRDMILQGGRHFNISCMCTSHLALDNRATAFPIKESDMFVVFPSRNKQQTESLLTTYAKFSKEQIRKIMTLRTRWVQINKNVPEYVIYQTGAYLL